jgi:uncharacterized Tic20 family protein
MPVAVVCPACKAKLKAPDNLIGKKVKCPGCAKPVLVKAAGVAASAPTPAPAAKKPVKQAAPPVEEEPLDEVDEQEEPKAKKKPKTKDNEEGGASAPGGPTTDKERSTGLWIHLMPIVLGCCGGIGSFISLFMWISKRKESAFIDYQGKTWLNLYINVFALVFGLGIVSGILSFVGGLVHNMVGTAISGLSGLIIFAVVMYGLVMSLMTGLKAKKGEWYQPKMLFKVLK